MIKAWIDFSTLDGLSNPSIISDPAIRFPTHGGDPLAGKMLR